METTDEPERQAPEAPTSPAPDTAPVPASEPGTTGVRRPIPRPRRGPGRRHRARGYVRHLFDADEPLPAAAQEGPAANRPEQAAAGPAHGGEPVRR